MNNPVHPKIQAVIDSGCKDLELLLVPIPGNFIFNFFENNNEAIENFIVFYTASICAAIRGENCYTREDVAALMNAIANRPRATIIDFAEQIKKNA